MTAKVARVTVLALLLALASTPAGASSARPPVGLTATPARVDLDGAGRETIRVRNTGTSRVVVDVTRAGFALDLRGRPRIVPAGARRSAARWLTFRPRTLALAPGAIGTVTVLARPPRAAEPGDHDALLLLTTRRQPRGGVAVRMRMGVTVVVRAPGTVVRRLELRGLRVEGRGRARAIQLVVANRGNVTESLTRVTLSLSLVGRKTTRLVAVPRSLRPGTRGVVSFRYPSRVAGAASLRVELTTGSGRTLRRSYRLRL